MIRTDADRAPTDPEVRTPTVLAVLVVKDGDRWLRDCLQGLSAQTYPRLGVLAIDNGSTDGSRGVLEQALGEGRVRTLDRDRGVAGAVDAALQMPVAAEADYLLLLHDDTALEPDAVARLVEAAETIEGVGVVGPKVVDWDDPRILREVGRSTDRFGHPYTPLQDGEVDHGQYDRALEVLFVSSSAMLVGRRVWQRAGSLDERLTSHHEDLDFCWRARLAGFRVVMTPLARVRHQGASAKGERPIQGRRHTERYFAERASLAAMMKNYGLLSLLWLLPLYAVVGAGRTLLLAFSRRFEDAWELLSAWGWNLAHLPGTIRRRRRAQKIRAVKDRDIRRFMESAAVRLPRWIDEAGAILAEQSEIDEEMGEDEPPARRLRAHTRSLVQAHPVLVGAALALLVGFFMAGPVLSADPLSGGVVARVPASASGYFSELVSGVRTTVLGGAQAASPALGGLGALSWVLLGSTSFAQRLLLIALPAVGGAMVYRAVGRQTGERLGATVAAGAFGLSAVVLWSFSQGRIDLLVALAVLPVVIERLGAGFNTNGRQGWPRLAAGLGVALAAGIAFYPGIVLPTAVAAAVLLLTTPGRGRGLRTSIAGVAAAALLVFPLLPQMVGEAGPTLSSFVGEPQFAQLVRTVLGPGPGSWAIAWFLPLGALLSIVVVKREHRSAANRCAILAVAGIFLAWLSAAGYLPAAVSNPPAYIALVATAEAFLVGFGVAAIGSGFGAEAFGLRQIAAVGLGILLAAGLSLQTLGAIVGSKDVGQGRLPPAWPVVAQGAPGNFRVLWLGRVDGRPFPAPGGDPSAVLEAGSSSVRYTVTDRQGVSALDTGRGESGVGYDQLERSLAELVSGGSRHMGALLAPFGVRFVVAPAGGLPPRVAHELGRQLDLDPVGALGLTIYRNPAALPPASVVSANPRSPLLSEVADLGSIQLLPSLRTTALQPAPGGWSGRSDGSGGTVFVGQQFADGWRMSAGGVTTDGQPAFGWGVGFRAPAHAGSLAVTYGRQWIRTLEMIALGLLWLGALWVTRKPVSE